MGGQNREGTARSAPSKRNCPSRERCANGTSTGGKVKPLKASKKEKKELDEDDAAYLQKKRDGMPDPADKPTQD